MPAFRGSHSGRCYRIGAIKAIATIGVYFTRANPSQRQLLLIFVKKRKIAIKAIAAIGVDFPLETPVIGIVNFCQNVKNRSILVKTVVSSVYAHASVYWP